MTVDKFSKEPSEQFKKLMDRYEKATGKSRNSIPYVFGRKISDAPEPTITKERLAEIKQQMEEFMGFRASGCPRCGLGPYEAQVSLEQRIIEANDMHCAILETRRCTACDHRYAVEMYYRPDGERFIQNEHKKTTNLDYVPAFGIDWSQE